MQKIWDEIDTTTDRLDQELIKNEDESAPQKGRRFPRSDLSVLTN